MIFCNNSIFSCFCLALQIYLVYLPTERDVDIPNHPKYNELSFVKHRLSIYIQILLIELKN